MAIYFISDLHLQPAREDLASALRNFVDDKIKSGDTLYILGDFFDAWIGDDEDGSFYQEIRICLKTWVDRGITIYFMHGNRDFLIGERFASETGVQLISDPTLIEHSGKKILLMHGDSLCTQDTEYMAFRQQVRSEPWQQQVLSLPLDQRRIMAADLRKKSQSMNSNKAEDIMDVTPAEVEKALADSSADILLHGHTHRPAVHPLTIHSRSCERIVLGDWDKIGWYVKAGKKGVRLRNFDI